MEHNNLNFILDLLDDKTLIIGGKIGYDKSHNYTPELSKTINDLIEEINPKKIIVCHFMYIDLYYEKNILSKNRKVDIGFSNPYTISNKSQTYQSWYSNSEWCKQLKCSHKDPLKSMLNLKYKNLNLKTIFYDDVFTNQSWLKEFLNINDDSTINKFMNYYNSDNFYHIKKLQGNDRKFIINNRFSDGNASTGMLLINLLVKNNKHPYILGFNISDNDEYNIINRSKTVHNHDEESNTLLTWSNENKLTSLDLLAQKKLNQKGGKIYKINYYNNC